jgi:hypothetical protein
VKKVIFPTVNLKHIIMIFCFVVPQLADGIFNISECFKVCLWFARKINYSQPSRSLPWAKYLPLSNHANNGWFKELVCDDNLIREIQHIQYNHHDTITLAIHKTSGEVVLDESIDCDKDTVMKNIFVLCALFGTHKSDLVQFKLLQDCFALHGSIYITGSPSTTTTSICKERQ